MASKPLALAGLALFVLTYGGFLSWVFTGSLPAASFCIPVLSAIRIATLPEANRAVQAGMILDATLQLNGLILLVAGRLLPQVVLRGA